MCRPAYTAHYLTDENTVIMFVIHECFLLQTLLLKVDENAIYSLMFSNKTKYLFILTTCIKMSISSKLSLRFLRQCMLHCFFDNRFLSLYIRLFTVPPCGLFLPGFPNACVQFLTLSRLLNFS